MCLFFPESAFLFCFALCLTRILGNLYEGVFPESDTCVKRHLEAAVQETFGNEEPIPEPTDLNTMLTHISYRVRPIRLLGYDLVNSAIHLFRKFFPEEGEPDNLKVVLEKFKEIDLQFDEWKYSCARQGADTALRFVLSWYEDINLEQLRSMRRGSKWHSDSSLVELRKQAACALAEFADIEHFFEDMGEASGESNGEAEEEEEECPGNGEDLPGSTPIPTTSTAPGEDSASGAPASASEPAPESSAAAAARADPAATS